MRVVGVFKGNNKKNNNILSHDNAILSLLY